LSGNLISVCYGGNTFWAEPKSSAWFCGLAATGPAAAGRAEQTDTDGIQPVGSIPQYRTGIDRNTSEMQRGGQDLEFDED
jgi:hypothetical protein